MMKQYRATPSASLQLISLLLVLWINQAATKAVVAPHVIIVGGGPAGFLAAFLFDKRGIPVTIIEKSATVEQLASRSYGIQINEKGSTVLKKAGILEKIAGAGSLRKATIIEDHTGKQIVQYSKGPEVLFGISRPRLVECMEAIVSKCPNVTIIRGSGISRVVLDDPVSVNVFLEDGRKMICSHVVGADGKWSVVRSCTPSLNDNSIIRTEPSWGVSMFCKKKPSRWRGESVFVFTPKRESKFYILASPLQNGEYSISMVCNDKILSRLPWLEPSETSTGWDSDGTNSSRGCKANNSLQDNLTELLKSELPQFYKDVGRKTIATAGINRRVSWLDTTNSRSQSYSSKDGRVALIGDAAHAVTPSLGQGCNLALESAMSLVSSLPQQDYKDSNERSVLKDLNQAFKYYGKYRPIAVFPIQSKSAEASRSVH